MLKECSIWSIFKNHHSGERLIFLTISKKVDKIPVVNFWYCVNLKPEPQKQLGTLGPHKSHRGFNAICLSNTFFLNCASKLIDQSLADVTATEATAISTPLDKVPLWTVPIGEEPMTLLKSSQAVSSSDLLRFGTPAMQIPNHILDDLNHPVQILYHLTWLIFHLSKANF